MRKFRAEVPHARPNLILITTDQQRGDCLSCDRETREFGPSSVVETPNLDALAERGFRFNRAYSAVPSCTPARAGILTGMDQWNHGRLRAPVTSTNGTWNSASQEAVATWAKRASLGRMELGNRSINAKEARDASFKPRCLP